MTTSPGVLNLFFTEFGFNPGSSEPGPTLDPELKELMTALRFIQLDTSLTANDATTKITAQMIENIKEIDPLLNSYTYMGQSDKEKVNGTYQFNYIKFTPATTDPTTAPKKYEYFKLDVDVTNGDYIIDRTIKVSEENPSNDYNTVHNFLVKERLKDLMDDKVFKLFSTPVKNIDSLSSGTKAFKLLHSIEKDDPLYNQSLIDIILDLEKYLENSSTETTLLYSDKHKYELFKSIYEFMVKEKNTTVTDENSLIMDIVKFQNNIDKSKQNIKDQRNKIYTYLSRDKNYSKTLKTKRAMLYLSISALIIVSMLYSGILYTKSLSNADKSSIVLVIASLILFINMILYIIRITMQSKETFVDAPNSDGVQAVEGYIYVPVSASASAPAKPNQAKIVVAKIMKNFCTKYAEVLSKEIKNEYYDALYISQEKDKKLLDQLEKEHNIKSHFHQLKNNLTHFKINETKEYSKLSQLAIVLVSLVAILYLAVLQDTIDMKIFKIVSGLTLAIFITYVLLTIKSIMLRDKYDWDRFHWTVKNVRSKMNPEQCPLPGFPN